MEPEATGGAERDEPRAVGARWATPTGACCPRALDVHGNVVGAGDCCGCGFCLLLAGLIDDEA
jgi:hypothetical protein